MEIPTKTLRRSATLLALAASATMAVAELRPPRPNVLVIMPDDVSFDDFSYYRQDGPQTPNIDALARESVRFTDFHVSPTCSPTRAALLTGRSANATGVWHTILGRYFLHPDEITLADIMRRNGYATALFSKWHLGDSYPFRPQDRGFDTVCVVKGGGITQQPNPWGNRNVPPARIEDNGRWIELTDEDDGIPGAFATNYFSSRAIEHMRDQVRRGMPFFVMLAYNAAHAPHDRPPDARPGISARDATIENIDKNVGRVLNFLKENGLERDTLVLFLTDNGETARGLRGRKASHYEGGHRVPCFLRWPARGYGGSPVPGLVH